MQKLNAALAFSAMVAALAFGCSSDSTDGTGGLSGGATGKGGGAANGQGGSGNGSSSGGSSTGGSSVIIGTGNTTGTAASGGTSSGGSAASSAGGECTGTTASGMKGKGAVVFFLVDTSLSMNDHPTTGGMTGGGRGGGTPTGPTKMESTQTALDQAFGTLSNGLQVGLAFFPNVPVPKPMSNDPCYMAETAVPIAPLNAQQLTALTTSVDAATPDGGTPTFDAYTYAVQQLKASTAEGDKYIVLITDGIPTYGESCMGNGMPTQNPPIPMKPLIDASQNAFMNDGIKTFIVGSPGSETARATLSAMARVGGTGPTGCMDSGMPEYCHFDMTTSMDFGASLSAALGEIQMQIPVDCSFQLPTPPSGMTLDLGAVNVTVTNDDQTETPIAQDPNDDCATDGWVYVGNPPTAVKLCGALCDSVNAQNAPSIEVTFGCKTRVNPPR